MNQVTIELYEYNDIYADSLETRRLQVENEKLKEEIELLKSKEIDLPDEVELMGTPYEQYVVINKKKIKVTGGNIQLCNKKETEPYTFKIKTEVDTEELKKAIEEIKNSEPFSISDDEILDRFEKIIRGKEAEESLLSKPNTKIPAERVKQMKEIAMKQFDTKSR